MCVRFRHLVDFHLLDVVLAMTTYNTMAGPTYHFERVELFLDLLRKHRGEPVASCDISSAVVIVG
jgi:hypothetical protein